MKKPKSFRLEETALEQLGAFSTKNGFDSETDALEAILLSLPAVEAQILATLQAPKETPPSDNTTGAAGFSTSPKSPHDSPSSLPAAPDPIPLETSSSLKQTASTAISKTSDSGLSVGDNSKAISAPLLEKLRYQQLKAEIWQRTQLETERGKQAIREQVKRYHEADGRPARVEMAPDKGKPDCGAPDFYEYERN